MDMVRMMRSKDHYISQNQFPVTPPIFDTGDEVGVFYHVPRPHHKVGVIVRDDETGVTIKTHDGKSFRASVFQLFHLDNR
jgi:hypothetical protein